MKVREIMEEKKAAKEEVENNLDLTYHFKVCNVCNKIEVLGKWYSMDEKTLQKVIAAGCVTAFCPEHTGKRVKALSH